MDIDFAMHDGVATRWAREAHGRRHPGGDGAGQRFRGPGTGAAPATSSSGTPRHCPPSTRCWTAIGDAPAQVFLESAHHDDRELPTGRNDVDLGGPQRITGGRAGRGGGRGGLRRPGSLRLGGLRQPHHPRRWPRCCARTTRSRARIDEAPPPTGRPDGLPGAAAASGTKRPRASRRSLGLVTTGEHQQRDQHSHQPARRISTSVRRPSRPRNACASVLITSDRSAISPPIGRGRCWRTTMPAPGFRGRLRSEASAPSTTPFARIDDARQPLADLAEQPVGLPVHVGGVQRIAVLEVSVQRGSRTPRSAWRFRSSRRPRRHARANRSLGGVQDTSRPRPRCGGRPASRARHHSFPSTRERSPTAGVARNRRRPTRWRPHRPRNPGMRVSSSSSATRDCIRGAAAAPRQ